MLETLVNALNERNQRNKGTKFGFSTSEDALTWTVFRYLFDSGQLLGVLRGAGLPVPDRENRPESMLLWGVPVPLDRDANKAGWLLRDRLVAISDDLGEDPKSRTEPDVVIDLGADGVIIIEVKHRSGTDLKKPTYSGWDRYYPADSPLTYSGAVRASCCYELARNWRFGLELSADPARPFTLACLGPEALFRGKNEEVLRPFEASVPATGTALFRKIRWDALIGTINEPLDWITDFVETRGYRCGGDGYGLGGRFDCP
ncbi:nuclease-related domain-containing protein [Tautonia plasticadhaerens]|uniref:nuclease-related domain-containing protein n=1 Tax=Tautonia plasticadhaerens TaxID=2527974 RepID=UPI0011A85FB1|nr:nuclease-related domain-containing protein [Tautonia plasticadhaerens]